MSQEEASFNLRVGACNKVHEYQVSYLQKQTEPSSVMVKRIHTPAPATPLTVLVYFLLFKSLSPTLSVQLPLQSFGLDIRLLIFNFVYQLSRPEEHERQLANP